MTDSALAALFFLQLTVILAVCRGVGTPTLFTILVLMAIATTLMTGPVFSLVWERKRASSVAPWAAADRVP